MSETTVTRPRRNSLWHLFHPHEVKENNGCSWFCLMVIMGFTTVAIGDATAQVAPDGKGKSKASLATRLERSLNNWERAKATCKGTYSYKVVFRSFSGMGHDTEIFVEQNRVAKRTFKSVVSRRLEPVNDPPQRVEWTEIGRLIGSHKEGAPPKTLDELYAEAKKMVQQPVPEHEKMYLRFDKAGLLLSCFTVDTRIADDAPIKGVRIASISIPGAAVVHKAPNGKVFPAHWGAPPRIQTRDLRSLPGGYGRGSGTLARWIQENLDSDAKSPKKQD